MSIGIWLPFELLCVSRNDYFSQIVGNQMAQSLLETGEEGSQKE